MNLRQVFLRDGFVLTPIENAYNSQTAYWISKNGYIGAMYYFTHYEEQDTKVRLTQKGFDESGIQKTKLFTYLFGSK